MKLETIVIAFNLSKRFEYLAREISEIGKLYKVAYSSDYNIIHDIRELDGNGDLIHFVLAVPKDS